MSPVPKYSNAAEFYFDFSEEAKGFLHSHMHLTALEKYFRCKSSLTEMHFEVNCSCFSITGWDFVDPDTFIHKQSFSACTLKGLCHISKSQMYTYLV